MNWVMMIYAAAWVNGWMGSKMGRTKSSVF